MVQNGDLIDQMSKYLLARHRYHGEVHFGRSIPDRIELRNVPVHFTVNVAAAQIEARIVHP